MWLSINYFQGNRFALIVSCSTFRREDRKLLVNSLHPTHHYGRVLLNLFPLFIYQLKTYKLTLLLLGRPLLSWRLVWPFPSLLFPCGPLFDPFAFFSFVDVFAPDFLVVSFVAVVATTSDYELCSYYPSLIVPYLLWTKYIIVWRAYFDSLLLRWRRYSLLLFLHLLGSH